MKAPDAFDGWSAARSYDHYMGRWSRRIAAKFVAWLAPPRDAAWLEIGCGTGALTAAILAEAEPRSILAIDPSADFIAHLRSVVDDPRLQAEMADARKLPREDASIDVVTSGLVMNFIADRASALREMQRVLKPDGRCHFMSGTIPAAASASSMPSGRRQPTSIPRPAPWTRRAGFPSAQATASW
ncbi:class I SAM-dependent methyltransferase [Phreatobacter stygius]|uniref:class I SAM-dependent methyltransferase n=1 Tax=Phreatobacter stygius TaxID=1940610 RepID=UPI001FE376BE|nr:class I SAM-dependent methyltransferase [Phreatobacter stygius]